MYQPPIWKKNKNKNILLSLIKCASCLWTASEINDLLSTSSKKCNNCNQMKINEIIVN